MGIKSFQGNMVGKTADIKHNIHVSDFMRTDLITFNPDDSIYEAINKLIKHKISGGPVVDAENNLVGMVSEGDCVKHIADLQYYNSPLEQKTVAAIMTTVVETIPGNKTIFEASKQFLQSRKRRFPIVEGQKLVGLISQKDILRASVLLKENTWRKE
ncbi:MAG: CBS domain-containing protein [Flavobacteriaceae bacterium]|nr:CBS domain-containing protein [Flavobacteriaceae bacterium]